MADVTIVIPSYNHARFLPECLRSIQRQTFEDWQVVLIDDGSKDDSVELARRFAQDDPRISVYVNEQNLGTYGTEQRGLDLSNSPYVAIMNSDDVWAPTKLERQVEALTAHPEVPLCYVLGWMIDDEGREIEGEDVHFDWPRDEIQDVLPYLLYENRILASGVLFRREGLRFETTCRYSGDWVALLERAYTGPVSCVPERLNFWRQHDNNTYRISPKQLAEEIRVREAVERRARDWFLPRLAPALVRRGMQRNAMNLFALYVYFHDFAGARRAGLSAIRYGDDRKSAIKRTLSTLLPAGYLRRYFWTEDKISLSDPDRTTLRSLQKANTPLTFRI
jgi:glycosyltransferase involved in cell wall biosynthesis